MHLSDSVLKVIEEQHIAIPRFYEILLRDHPALRPFFDETDLATQSVKVSTAIQMIEMHTYRTSRATSTEYLRKLGRMHQDLGVTPDLYPMFADSLIQMLREVLGDEWVPWLETEWRQAIDSAVAVMLEEYDSRSA